MPSTLCIFKCGEFFAGALRMASQKRYSAPARNSEKIHMLPPKIPKHYASDWSSNEFSGFLAGAHAFFSEFLAGAEYFLGCHSQDSHQKVLFLFSRHSGLNCSIGYYKGFSGWTRPLWTRLKKNIFFPNFFVEIGLNPPPLVESSTTFNVFHKAGPCLRVARTLTLHFLDHLVS